MGSEQPKYLRELAENSAELKYNVHKAWKGEMSENDFKNTIYEKGADFLNEKMEEAYQKRHPDYKASDFNKVMKAGLYVMDKVIGPPIGHGIYGAGLATRENFDIYYNSNPLGIKDNFERSWDAFQRATDLGL